MRYGNQEFSEGNISSLSATRTVNLLTTDTTAEKQAKIDEVPRQASVGGAQVIFQFEDGTHTETATLTFQGFTYSIVIRGNTSDPTGLSTSKSVTIDGSSLAANVLTIRDCFRVTVDRLKILPQTSSWQSGVYSTNCNRLEVRRCYIQGNGSTTGIGCYYIGSNGKVSDTYFNTMDTAMFIDNCHISSQNNDDTGTSPEYGLYATDAGIIGKNGTQPSGSISSELSDTGGVVRS